MKNEHIKFKLTKFNVIDEQKNIREVIVRERKPKWGLLHYTEIRMNHDLEKLNIGVFGAG